MTARLFLHLLLIPLFLAFVSSSVPQNVSAQIRNSQSGSSSAERNPDDRTAIKEFQKRLKAYAKLERKLESQLPKLPEKAEPERIEAHKSALAKAIQQKRANAKEGDLFIPDVRPILMAIVRSETTGAQGAPVREEITETAAKRAADERPAAVTLKPNTLYPSNVSLSTVPAELLMKLPKLPPEVDYRFVGRNLILRSVRANLILDVLPGVLPSPARKKQ
jgi:hypothetical protein